jgi:hypothetical protein
MSGSGLSKAQQAIIDTLYLFAVNRRKKSNRPLIFALQDATVIIRLTTTGGYSCEIIDELPLNIPVAMFQESLN